MPSLSSRPCLVVLLSGALLTAWSEGASGDDLPEPEPTSTHLTIKERGKLVENSFFVEGGGAGVFYSFNYERMFLDQLGVRAGVGLLLVGSASGLDTTSFTSEWIMFVPVTASYVGIRSGRHALELGGGLTLHYASGGAAPGLSVPFLGVAMAGYRTQPIGGRPGFMFRAGIEALMGGNQYLGLAAGNPNVLPWPYLSLGGSF